MVKELGNIFGNKSQFAIEAKLWQLDENPIFISWCLWIRGDMVGDIEQRALLSAEMARISKVTKHKGERHIPSVEMAANNLTDKLVDAIWGDDYHYMQYPFSAYVDILSQHGECFQGYFVFLVEQKGYEWLLAKDNVENNYYDIKLSAGMIYSYFEEFSAWIADSTMLTIRTEKALITNE
ncbi:Imm42 family immunity protein [Muribaculum gordoncarteri]|uniref:Imm42 family immunity protein n=1 Tax=Muribaculum gordoncarteri TaxID=2530390 RepID=UPI00248C0DFB|nr:Imm42 family immunity protein [Muribaculum gordoncarteri]